MRCICSGKSHETVKGSEVMGVRERRGGEAGGLGSDRKFNGIMQI